MHLLPSLFNINRVQNNEIESCSLDRRISNAPLPKIRIHQATQNKTTGGISNELLTKVKNNQKAGFQTLILFKSKGVMPQFLCAIRVAGLLKVIVVKLH